MLQGYNALSRTLPMLELDPHCVVGNELPDPISPFHNHDGIAVAECLAEPEMLGFGQRLEAVGVDVDEVTG